MRDQPKTSMILIFTIGFCAIPAQVILMREFLTVFGGNELYVGLFLAVWMLLTAAGSYTAGFWPVRETRFPVYTIILAGLPVLLLCIPDLLRNRIFLPGLEPGLFIQFFVTALLLLPFCFLSGRLFSSIAGRMSAPGGKNMPGKAYGIESAGSMAGGLLFTLVLVFLYDNFRAAAIVAATGCILVLSGWRGSPHKKLLLLLSSAVMVPAILSFLFGNSFARHYLYPDQLLIESRDTPYGNLAITQTGQQTNVFENNVLLFSTDNQQASEEAIHFALVQHPEPKRVLLISGGITGLTTEILKYSSVDSLDYIEIDPIIFEIGKKFTNTLAAGNINLIRGDPRMFLQKTRRHYDAVIAYLPPPSSFQINRYYTIEFMNLVKERMNKSGIYSFSLPLTANYLNEGSIEMYSSLYRTSLSKFASVHIFPGLRGYFVASDQTIVTNALQLIENKNINTDYVNSYYMDEPEMERRSLEIVNQLHPAAELNTDFEPVAVTAFNKYWLNRYQLDIRSFRIFILMILGLIFVGMLFISPVHSGMFAAGFSSASMQVVLILSFQIVFGYIFKTVGLLTAMFMLGLAIGAILPGRLIRDNRTTCLASLPFLHLLMAVISFLIPFFILITARLSHMPQLLLLLYLFVTWIISMVTGIIFSFSARYVTGGHTHNIPKIYGADLAGASTGALVTTLLFIPAAGIRMASCLAGLLNLFIAFLFVFRQNIRMKKTRSS